MLKRDSEKAIKEEKRDGNLSDAVTRFGPNGLHASISEEADSNVRVGFSGHA